MTAREKAEADFEDLQRKYKELGDLSYEKTERANHHEDMPTELRAVVAHLVKPPSTTPGPSAAPPPPAQSTSAPPPPT